MTTEAELRERVFGRGAPFLDQAEPRWWKRVERQLRMASCRSCVLGQLHGPGDAVSNGYEVALATYCAGFDQLERNDWAVTHGFERLNDESYADLDRLWREAIEARRGDPDR